MEGNLKSSSHYLFNLRVAANFISTIFWSSFSFQYALPRFLVRVAQFFQDELMTGCPLPWPNSYLANAWGELPRSGKNKSARVKVDSKQLSPWAWDGPTLNILLNTTLYFGTAILVEFAVVFAHGEVFCGVESISFPASCSTHIRRTQVQDAMQPSRRFLSKLNFFVSL